VKPGIRQIDGAVGLVIGGAGGIGGAITTRLRHDGATVVSADLPGRGADADLDLRDVDALHGVVGAVARDHGRVDLVVNSAGMGVAGAVETLHLDAWRRAVDVNLWGSINTVLAAYPHLCAQRHGHLVLVASLSGLLPTPLLVPYATAKGGVVSLAAGLRPEAARHGVGVSVVCPGPVETPLLDTGGVGGETQGVDVRRYLTSAAGPALAPEAVADAVVRAIRGNRAVVVPGRPRLLWLAARLSPRVAERAVARAMRRELVRAEAAPPA
jgi:short-subunit dehydrogenase